VLPILVKDGEVLVNKTLLRKGFYPKISTTKFLVKVFVKKVIFG